MDQFCTRLRQLSLNCDFAEGTVENEVKTQMIHGCKSQSLRKKGLSKAMDLKTLLDHGKSMELAVSQSHVIEDTKPEHADVANRVYKHDKHSGTRGARQKFKSHSHVDKSFDKTSIRPCSCFNCGGQYPHDGECQLRWLSGLRRSRVHSLVIARRSLCPEKLGSNPGQGSKGINFSGWHGLDMSITVTKRR